MPFDYSMRGNSVITAGNAFAAFAFFRWSRCISTQRNPTPWRQCAMAGRLPNSKHYVNILLESKIHQRTGAHYDSHFKRVLLMSLHGRQARCKSESIT